MERPKFIRPAGGFKIVLDAKVKLYIDAECLENIRFSQYWGDFLARLKITALREGENISGDVWSFLAEGAPKFGVPTVQVLFTHDLTSIYIKSALVWQDGDLDPDDDL